MSKAKNKKYSVYVRKHGQKRLFTTETSADNNFATNWVTIANWTTTILSAGSAITIVMVHRPIKTPPNIGRTRSFGSLDFQVISLRFFRSVTIVLGFLSVYVAASPSVGRRTRLQKISFY